MFLEQFIISSVRRCVIAERRGRDSVEEFQHDPRRRVGSVEHVQQLARSSQRLGTTLRAHEPSVPDSALQPPADTLRATGKYRTSLSLTLISISLSLVSPPLSLSLLFGFGCLEVGFSLPLLWSWWFDVSFGFGVCTYQAKDVLFCANWYYSSSQHNCEEMIRACNDTSMLSFFNTSAN